MVKIKEHICPYCGEIVFYRKMNNKNEMVLWMHSLEEEKHPEKPRVRFRRNTATFSLTLIPLYSQTYETYIEMLKRKQLK